MRTIYFLSFLILIGCSVSGLENSTPALTEQTSKSVDEYSLCLSGKWLDLNSTTRTVKTESGVKIMVIGPVDNVIFLSVIKEENDTTLVKVYGQTIRVGGGGFIDAAKGCL